MVHLIFDDLSNFSAGEPFSLVIEVDALTGTTPTLGNL